MYQHKLGKARRNYYSKEISKLKKSDPRKLYYWLKRLVPGEECKRNEVNIEELNQLSKEEQAEIIANEMSKVRNKYEPLNINEINFPHYNKQDIPIVSVNTVENHFKRLKINKATTINDIPPKILKLSAPHIAVPLTNLINSSIKDGTWPDISK